MFYTSFIIKDDGATKHPDISTNWLNKFSEANDLPYIHPHAFGYTVTSILTSKSVDPITTTNEFGHTDANTANTIYAHQIVRAETSGVCSGVFIAPREL